MTSSQAQSESTKYDFTDDVGSNRRRLLHFEWLVVTLSKAKGLVSISEILCLGFRMTQIDALRLERFDLTDPLERFYIKEV